MSDEPIFEGFERPTRNYFPMPNEWIDICSRIKSLAEIKVIFYILRHTWGYQEYGITKVISFDEFMSGRKRNDGSRIDSGTCLSRQSVIDGLNLAVKHGYIICEVDASDLARVKKSYALKMRSGVKNLDPQISSLNSIPQGSNIYTSEVKEVDSSGLNSTPRSEKNTIEKHLGNTPKERQESIVVSAIAENDAPAATIHDLQKWKEESGKTKAVEIGEANGTDSIPDSILAGTHSGTAFHHHVLPAKDIQQTELVSGSHVDIGNDDLEETVKHKAIKIGDIHDRKLPIDTTVPMARLSRDEEHMEASLGEEESKAQRRILTSQQTPAAGTRSFAADPLVGIQDDSASVQATIGSPADAAQRTAPPGGAVQASIPQRPRGKKVTQAKPAITLTVQEQAFWDLWRSVWFNVDIPPDLTETAYGHVKKLAPFITTSEQLTSLIDYTRKDLAASQNIKRKMVQLGNMVFCYSGWKQAQQKPVQNGKADAYGNDYSLTALLARQQKAM